MDGDGAIKESSVRIRFFIVKAAFYDRDAIPIGDIGKYAIGKHDKTVTGISIVRAGRKIDFGRFDFDEDVNEPTHLYEDSDLRTSFELLISAYGMAMNETNVPCLNQGNQLLHKWMSKLRDYMYMLRNPDN